MKKGCCYCEARFRCYDAFMPHSVHCGAYNHEEMPKIDSYKRNYTIYAVDFDGTLCVNKFPEIGAPNKALIEHLIKSKEKGNKLILWTCRVAEKLQEAVDWCKAQGLEFDTVNENLPEIIVKFGRNNRKVFADVYIDDKAVNKQKYHIPYTEEEL